MVRYCDMRGDSLDIQASKGFPYCILCSVVIMEFLVPLGFLL